MAKWLGVFAWNSVVRAVNFVQTWTNCTMDNV